MFFTRLSAIADFDWLQKRQCFAAVFIEDMAEINNQRKRCSMFLARSTHVLMSEIANTAMMPLKEARVYLMIIFDYFANFNMPELNWNLLQRRY